MKYFSMMKKTHGLMKLTVNTSVWMKLLDKNCQAVLSISTLCKRVIVVTNVGKQRQGCVMKEVSKVDLTI